MNFKEVVIKVKKRLERGSEYDGHIYVCCVCPFQYKDCVEDLTQELKKRKINDKPFRVNVEKPYSYFDCSRAYETLHKTLFRNVKI